MKREPVVVTGIGVVSPVGIGYETFLDGLRNGRSAAARLTAFPPDGLRSANVCEVKGYRPTVDPVGRKKGKTDRGSHLLLTAAAEALASARFDGPAAERCAVVVGTTLGGMVSATEYYRLRKRHGHEHVRMTLDYPPHAAGAHVAARFGLLGPALTLSTACSSANMAIGQGIDLIASGMADAALVGGYDTMALITCYGFGSLRNVSPDTCRPFDRNRNGIILGEGAACLLLEPLSKVQKRKGTSRGVVLGYGMGSDAYHMTAPDITGAGPAACMRAAIEDAGLAPEQIDYVNAHGTGTTHNDAAESAALRKVFGADHVPPISSSKSMFGHTLGAAGALEAVACLAAMEGGFLPPTINVETPDPRLGIDPVPNVGRSASIRTALSNNFGFGGNNCSVVFGAGDTL
jgi:3-oxoacyl-(acyl-carrier-protein) synthase